MKNIKRLSTRGLAAVATSTLILGLVACGSDDNSAPGTDENGVDTDGVVKVDENDTGIDVGPVTDPLSVDEKLNFTQDADSNYEETPYSFVVTQPRQEDDRTCFTIQVEMEEIVDADGMPLKIVAQRGMPNYLPTGGSYNSETETNLSKAASSNLRLNIIHGGRIAERTLISVGRDGGETTLGEKDGHITISQEICAYNPNREKVNVRPANLLGAPDVADIQDNKMENGYDPEPDITGTRLIDHQDSTGWVIDPQ